MFGFVCVLVVCVCFGTVMRCANCGNLMPFRCFFWRTLGLLGMPWIIGRGDDEIYILKQHGLTSGFADDVIGIEQSWTLYPAIVFP